MKELKVLDVTLRDGGCVNDFSFGESYMNSILTALEQSKVDMIELGYIDSAKGSEKGRTQFCNEQVITQHFLKKKQAGKLYVAMIDYGKFNLDDLQPRTENSIDGIRFAFHKKDYHNIVSVGKKIMSKGYQFFIQPMTTLRYNDMELLELIEMVNTGLPDASGFYIVDSFGEMRPNDMDRILNLVDHNLTPNMPVGFHSHNNLQMSYANAISLLKYPTNRTLMIDCSIMGMGKGAGNLNTELLLEHLNLYYGKQYQIAPLLEVMDTVLNQIKSEFYWGYSVEYYLSSVNRCTPSYAGHFYKKHMLSIDQVAELLGMIREDKKISFDKEYAENLYFEYNKRKRYDDTNEIEQLRNVLMGKTVAVIAPGKSILENQDAVEAYVRDTGIVSISLNAHNLFDTDYVLTTRGETYKHAVEAGKKVIATSNVSNGEESVITIDYQKWAVVDDGVRDSAGVVVLNLLQQCGVKEILLAGFDGFSPNVNANYYDPLMRHPVTEQQSDERNMFYKKFISDAAKNVSIQFITRSAYEFD